MRYVYAFIGALFLAAAILAGTASLYSAKVRQAPTLTASGDYAVLP